MSFRVLSARVTYGANTAVCSWCFLDQGSRHACLSQQIASGNEDRAGHPDVRCGCRERHLI